MKQSTLPLALVLVAASAFAQEKPAADAPKPDFSRDHLMRIFNVDNTPPPRPRRMTFEGGAVNFRALGMRWRIPFVPMLPLSGSRMTTSIDMPNPFELTHTEIAQTPRTFVDRRAMSAELRRIDKLDKKRTKVVVKP
jgi:hypothetical protein